MHRTHSALCVGHASILPIPFNKKLVSVPPASHVNIRAVHTVSIFYSKVNIKFGKKVWNKELNMNVTSFLEHKIAEQTEHIFW